MSDFRPTLIPDTDGLSAAQVQEFVAWLNPKGHRELALKNALTKWWNHIAPGMRRRAAVRAPLLPPPDSETDSKLSQDLNANAKIPEARRSTRKHAGAELLREPYMQWTNRKAVNGS